MFSNNRFVNTNNLNSERKSLFPDYTHIGFSLLYNTIYSDVLFILWAVGNFDSWAYCIRPFKNQINKSTNQQIN